MSNPAFSVVKDFGNLLIKTELNATEFHIKTENLDLITLGTDNQLSASYDVINAYSLMYSLSEQMKSEPFAVKMGSMKRFFKTSKLLLRLLSEFENLFMIPADRTTPDANVIGSMAWYVRILGVIEEVRSMIQKDIGNQAVNQSALSLRFEQIVQIKQNWQSKAQSRFPPNN